jgi:phage tail sheath protein FI
VKGAANSGIYVLEGMSRGQRIAVRRETVVAFLGTTPRGPVNIPVTIRSVNEYMVRFGSPGFPDKLCVLLTQFFDNGGTKAIVVRISLSERYGRISMSGPSGPLVLDAINPGPWESLRASIDYDHIPEAETDRFNLVIHRMTSPTVHIVEEQEIFSAVSVNPDHSNYLGHALLDSGLVRTHGLPPTERPTNTLRLGIDAAASYVYANTEWKPGERLTDYDLVGSNSEGTGLFALDLLPILDLVCMVPDDGCDIGPVGLFMAERYCRKRNAVLLMDPPSQWTSIDSVLSACREQAFSSPNVITYFPRIKVKAGQGKAQSTSALGAIAGGLAAEGAVDGLSGIRGRQRLTLRCRPGLEIELTDSECLVLARNGINALIPEKPGAIRMSGLVTFARNTELAADWSDLRKRRSAMFIVESIARGTRWAAFDENSTATWTEVRRQVELFLQELFEQGGLSGTTSKSSYFIVCDGETNRPDRSPAGDSGNSGARKFIFFVGFALQGSAFATFRFVHDAFECRVDELGWQPGVALAS